MPSRVDNAALREAPTSTDLARRLRQLSKELPIEQVTDDLLAGVKSEALPPDVFAIYLSAVGSPSALIAGLRQQFSRFVRYAAIKQFGQALKRSSWESVWDEIGGTEGLLRLFKDLSVVEVNLFCRVIGWAAPIPTGGSTLMQQRVTELLQGLLPRHFPECLYKSSDDRPLRGHYVHLVPACTSEFVKELMCNDGDPFDELEQLPIRRVAQSHWPWLQDLFISTLRAHNFEAESTSETPLFSFLALFLPYLTRDIPQIAGHAQGFSASMSFSLKVLRDATQGESYFGTSYLGNEYYDREKKGFWPTMVMPLVRRGVSRQLETHAMQEIFDLALSYLEACSPEVSAWCDKASFLTCVAKQWSIQTRSFEKQLIAALKIQPVTDPDRFPRIEGLFEAVNQEDRYDLLRLIILHSHIWKADINNDSDLRDLPIKKWPIGVFHSLPLQKAHEILLRLMRLKPEDDFLDLWAYTPSSELHYGDPSFLSFLLGSKMKTVTQEEAQKTIEREQERAFKSRDQTARASYAKSAAFYAIASGSLDLYDKVMIWSRRYVPDPLSLKTIYSSDTINTTTGIALLSGIPEDLSQHSISTIRKSVMQGNQTLLNIFETAILALNEPSFNPRDWDGPKSIFRDVVIARLVQSNRLGKILGLSDENVYDILWQPTLELMIKVEEIGLQPGHEALGFNLPNGPLSETLNKRDMPPQGAFSASSYRFFDNLARARNELWVQYRPTIHPECASLPREWPRGLPIQALIHDFKDRLCEHVAQPFTPYISSRALAASFLEHNPAEEDLKEETQTAIGRFVDHYGTALKIRILQQKPGKTQEDEASAVVTNFVGLRCGSGLDGQATKNLTKHEALQLFGYISRTEMPQLKIAAIREDDEFYSRGYPSLPSDMSILEPQEQLEWNPIEGRSQKVSSRRIITTLLDCMIDAKLVVSLDPFRTLQSSVQSREHTGIWSTRKIRGVKQEGRAIEEGTIVSALVFLESRIATTRRILTSAFPSPTDIRYPPLFLDEEFLEQSKNEETKALEAVFHLRCKVPSTLLQQLSENTLKALSNPDLNPTERSSRESTAYSLLRLLLQSDRPDSAIYGLVATLVDHPEASSWHRQLLTKYFLRLLFKSQAQRFMDSFVSSIHAKLDEQTHHRENRPKSPQDEGVRPLDSPPKPIIKITTIKLLAQFLDDADFVSTKASIQILSDLLMKSSHVDVRVAVIESMTSKLERCSYTSRPDLEDQILQVLAECIPIMSGLNEARAMEEQDWTLAEQKCELPDVAGHGELSEDAPIFNAISLGSWRAYYNKFFEKVLLPVLSKSIENNSRWVALFARKFGLGSSHKSLPTSAVYPEMFVALMDWGLKGIPQWLVDAQHQHALINIMPPEWLTAFNNRLRNDPKTFESNAIRHWRSLYDRGPDLITRTTRRCVGFLCEHTYHGKVNFGKLDLIQEPHVQKCLVEQGSSLLWLRDPDFTAWNSFIKYLEPPDSKYDKPGWLLQVRVVIGRLIMVVDEIRESETWQRAPHKTKTPFLPPTLPLWLLLLDFPILYPKLPKGDSVRFFARQVVGLLREVYQLGLSHHEKLVEIADALNRLDRVELDDRVLLACLIGEFQGNNEEIDGVMELRAELSNKILDGVALDEEQKRLQATTLVRGWVRSRLEGVRMRGVKTGRKMKLDVEQQEEDD